MNREEERFTLVNTALHALITGPRGYTFDEIVGEAIKFADQTMYKLHGEPHQIKDGGLEPEVAAAAPIREDGIHNTSPVEPKDIDDHRKWNKHEEGNPMPCNPDTLVYVISNHGRTPKPSRASFWEGVGMSGWTGPLNSDSIVYWREAHTLDFLENPKDFAKLDGWISHTPGVSRPECDMVQVRYRVGLEEPRISKSSAWDWGLMPPGFDNFEIVGWRHSMEPDDCDWRHTRVCLPARGSKHKIAVKYLSGKISLGRSGLPGDWVWGLPMGQHTIVSWKRQEMLTAQERSLSGENLQPKYEPFSSGE